MSVTAARVGVGEQRLTRIEGRVDAAIDRLEALLVSGERTSLATRVATVRAAPGNAPQPLDPMRLPPLALAAPRAADAADTPRVLTVDVVREPSKAVLPAIGAAEARARDAELSASYGWQRVTYDVWRAGPVPASWAPPPSPPKPHS